MPGTPPGSEPPSSLFWLGPAPESLPPVGTSSDSLGAGSVGWVAGVRDGGDGASSPVTAVASQAPPPTTAATLAAARPTRQPGSDGTPAGGRLAPDPAASSDSRARKASSGSSVGTDARRSGMLVLGFEPSVASSLGVGLDAISGVVRVEGAGCQEMGSVLASASRCPRLAVVLSVLAVGLVAVAVLLAVVLGRRPCPHPTGRRGRAGVRPGRGPRRPCRPAGRGPRRPSRAPTGSSLGASVGASAGASVDSSAAVSVGSSVGASVGSLSCLARAAAARRLALGGVLVDLVTVLVHHGRGRVASSSPDAPGPETAAAPAVVTAAIAAVAAIAWARVDLRMSGCSSTVDGGLALHPVPVAGAPWCYMRRRIS